MKTILLPGFGASRRDFSCYEQKFSPFKVINFHESITLEDHLNEIHHSLLQDPQKATIIGVSWGGLLALIYAEMYPENIENMVITGSDRRLRMPDSLTFIMKLPFPLFSLTILCYVLVYPIIRLIDPKGYKQKYGGVGVLQRYGWKKTHTVYRNTLLKTNFTGKIVHPTLLLNLETDYLVSNDDLIDLSEQGSNSKVMIKYVKPEKPHQIHMSHELDELIIREAKLAFP